MKKPCSSCEHRTGFKKHNWCQHNFEDNCVKYQKYKEHLEKRKKYTQGDIIKTLEELNSLEIVYFRSSPKPMAFIVSMQYRNVVTLLKRGMFRHCVKKEV